ncbi:hypothetical protein [Phytohabitans houttuyneae]|uniref:hypothetical protein n=1 Tax=Phytohabitans houttuyneae TaxID=1076126 RepID=UPI00156418C9|nr:hypothetical protein [Phytohabitans houttuyneae]
MRKPAKTAAVLVGLGVGAAAGPSLGAAAVWSGVAVAAVGVVLSLLGSTEPAPGDGAERQGRNPQRPTLSGLGTRVEQVLELAEEQAADHRAEARREAEEIVTTARREAEAIVNRAREQAAGDPTT